MKKYKLTYDSRLGGNTYELRSQPHGHSSTACKSVESVRKQRGNSGEVLSDGKVWTVCL